MDLLGYMIILYLRILSKKKKKETSFPQWFHHFILSPVLFLGELLLICPTVHFPLFTPLTPCCLSFFFPLPDPCYQQLLSSCSTPHSFPVATHTFNPRSRWVSESTEKLSPKRKKKGKEEQPFSCELDYSPLPWFWPHIPICSFKVSCSCSFHRHLAGLVSIISDSGLSDLKQNQEFAKTVMIEK